MTKNRKRKKSKVRNHAKKHDSDQAKKSDPISRAEPGGALSNVVANDTDRIGHEVEVVSESRLAKTNPRPTDTASPRA